MWKRFTELFTIPRNRRATLAAATLHIGQNLCGINSRLASRVSQAYTQRSPFTVRLSLCKADPPSNKLCTRLWDSVGSRCSTDLQALMFRPSQLRVHLVRMSLSVRADPRPAVFTIDTFGRRGLNLTMFPNMAWALFAAGKVLRLPC
jgi:hypothetical protein